MKYAEQHKTVSADISELRTFFMACHANDVSDGTYDRVIAELRAVRRRKAKGKGGVANDKPSSPDGRHGNDNRRPSRRGRQQRNADSNGWRFALPARRYGREPRYRVHGDTRQRERQRERRTYDRDRRPQDRGRWNDRRRDREHDRSHYRDNDHDRGRVSRNDNRHADKSRRDGHNGAHAHHVSENAPHEWERRSRSRSAPRSSHSQERSPSRNRSVSDMSQSTADRRSPSMDSRRSDLFHVDEADQSPAAAPATSIDPTRARWLSEMSRGKPKKNKEGRVKGFGSWYQRRPGNYSRKEYLAEQGHRDRIRMADYTMEDRAERELADDDSQIGSDWLDRTSIDPTAYRACKEEEREMKARRDENKRQKRGY
jgi:hypothetical protein